MTAIIQVDGLSRTFMVLKRRTGILGQLKNLILPAYRQVHAVHEVCFSLERGELVGYLGPNGAGKSTTLKMLTGLLTPTSGSVVVNGYIPWKQRSEYVRRIGAVFGQRSALWWDLPVIDSLDMMQAIYRIPTGRYKENLNLFIQMLEMGPFLNSPVRSLSLGQRMRADLCAALLHDPEIIFLDEPTIGLDVVAKERIRNFIRELNQQRGTTVILTTHDLSDVEKLCERVMIIDTGRMLFDGSLSELTARFEQERMLIVHFEDDYRDVDVPGVASPLRDGRMAVYNFDPREMAVSSIIGYLLEHFQVRDIEIKRAEIEDTIRSIYENHLL